MKAVICSVSIFHCYRRSCFIIISVHAYSSRNIIVDWGFRWNRNGNRWVVYTTPFLLINAKCIYSEKHLCVVNGPSLLCLQIIYIMLRVRGLRKKRVMSQVAGATFHITVSLWNSETTINLLVKKMGVACTTVVDHNATVIQISADMTSYKALDWCVNRTHKYHSLDLNDK